MRTIHHGANEPEFEPWSWKPQYHKAATQICWDPCTMQALSIQTSVAAPCVIRSAPCNKDSLSCTYGFLPEVQTEEEECSCRAYSIAPRRRAGQHLMSRMQSCGQRRQPDEEEREPEEEPRRRKDPKRRFQPEQRVPNCARSEENTTQNIKLQVVLRTLPREQRYLEAGRTEYLPESKDDGVQGPAYNLSGHRDLKTRHNNNIPLIMRQRTLVVSILACSSIRSYIESV